MNGSFSLPTWQDCHEMWCKKRRRKGGEGKAAAEDGGSSSKQTKRESVSDTLEPSNNPPVQPTSEEQTEGSLPPPEASSTFLRRQSIETVEMETEDTAANAYASRDGHSLYDREQTTQYSYTGENSKATYLQDSYHQRDYPRDYPEGSATNNSYKTSMDEYSHPYSRDRTDNGSRGSRYSQSSVHYEQLSPPTDQAKHSYTDQYRHYSYADGSSNKEYESSSSSSRYRDESASYLYRERYPDNFPHKREVFNYNDSQYDRYPVTAESKSRGSSPPQRGADSYPRW